MASHQRGPVVSVEAPGFQEMMQVDPAWGRSWSPGLDLERVEAELVRGVSEGMQLRGAGDEEGAGRLEIRVVESGIRAPALGSGGEIYMTLRATLYDEAGGSSLRRRQRCSSTGAPAQSHPRMIAGVIRGEQLPDWSDAQLQQAFDVMAWWCGGQLAERLGG